jgi:hyperosmotically inducible protein
MNDRALTLFLASMLAGLMNMPFFGGNNAHETKRAVPAGMDGVEDKDGNLTTQVKTAMTHDERLKEFDIAVVTTMGEIRLTGVVDNQGQIQQAIKLARSMEGAHAIRDQLSIKK